MRYDGKISLKDFYKSMNKYINKSYLSILL